MRKSKAVAVVCLFLASMSCATIVGDKTQLMPISSNPSEAEILITDEKGAQVFKGNTPTTVMLQKSDGTYWGGKSYVVRVAKDGYESQSISVTSHPNGWYLAGNIVFGGLIGWFIVDPFNGAMYTLKPEQVSSTLLAGKSAENGNPDGSIHIVLIDEVPQDLRDKMIRIN